MGNDLFILDPSFAKISTVKLVFAFRDFPQPNCGGSGNRRQMQVHYVIVKLVNNMLFTTATWKIPKLFCSAQHKLMTYMCKTDGQDREMVRNQGEQLSPIFTGK